MATQAGYRNALAVGEFRAIFISHVMSMLGMVVTEFALTVLIYTRTGSPLLSALVFTLGFAPHLLAGTLLSSLVDRLPVRRLLVGCNLATTGVALLMATPGMPVVALLGLSFCAGLITPVFAGARAATLPDVLPGPEYIPARSLMRATAQGAMVAGVGGGGLLLTIVTPVQALLINAGCFALSALILRLGTRERRRSHTPQGGVLRDSLYGVRAVFKIPSLRRVILFVWAVPSFAVFPEALAVPYAIGLESDTSGAGLMLASVAAGSLCGELLGTWFIPAAGRLKMIVPLGVLALAPLVVFGFHPPVWVAAGLLFLSGAGFAHHLGLDQLLLDVAPESIRPRALMIQSSGLMFWQGVGYAGAGALAELASPSIVIMTAGLIGATCAVALRPYRPAQTSA